jgi:hypothetical protein
MTKANILMLYSWKKIAVYCANLTKHINEVRENAKCFNVKTGCMYVYQCALKIMSMYHTDLALPVSLRSLRTCKFRLLQD